MKHEYQNYRVVFYWTIKFKNKSSGNEKYFKIILKKYHLIYFYW